VKQPKPKSERFEMLAPPEWFAGLDNWRRHQPDIPSRAEAIRRLVELAISAT
jgi:hypothetical protein